MGYAQGGRYVPPEFEQRVKVLVWVTTHDVTVQVWDEPLGGRPGAQLWIRRFDRPEGKTPKDCVAAGVRSIGSGMAGWIDLLDQDDQPLDGLEW